jgi:transposase
MKPECQCGEQCISKTFQLPPALWEQAQPLIPPLPPKKKVGRPRLDDRTALTAIFYVMRNGGQWKSLPRCLGAASTVHDRFQAWTKAGFFEALWRAGVLHYDEAKGIDWEWQSIDGAMTKAPLGGKRYRSQPHRSS